MKRNRIFILFAAVLAGVMSLAHAQAPIRKVSARPSAPRRHFHTSFFPPTTSPSRSIWARSTVTFTARTCGQRRSPRISCTRVGCTKVCTGSPAWAAASATTGNLSTTSSAWCRAMRVITRILIRATRTRILFPDGVSTTAKPARTASSDWSTSSTSRLPCSSTSVPATAASLLSTSSPTTSSTGD